MKLSDEEKKDMSEVSILDRPNYPCGLKLHLDPETVKKLEMDKPSVGERVKVIAMAEIDTISKASGRGDVSGFSITIQITDMEIDKKGQEEREDSPTENVFYGGNGDNES